jgi:F-type H+-transporting ATPase subunit gamma
MAFLREKQPQSPKLICIGKKGVDIFRRRHVELLGEHPHIAEGVTLRGADEIGQRAADLYLSGEVDEVHLIYASFVSTLKHPIVRQRLLPLDPEAMPEPEDEEEGVSRVMLHEPSHEGVCPQLFKSYLAAKVYLAFLESLSSEFASRMTAMDAATQNADDMIGRLTMDYNRARQQAITREILDIVGGAEALK